MTPPVELRPVTDAVVALRPATPEDIPVLLAGRDDEWRRWLGPGSDEPRPTMCIEVDGEVVGWVDVDPGHDWLDAGQGELNVGYQLFAAQRGRGYATRAVQLTLHRLSVDHGATHRAAALLIDQANGSSLALATRCGFSELHRTDNGQVRFRREVPPFVLTDGIVTIRPQREDDLEADLAAKDDEQIDWLWLPGHRESWEAMSPDEQRAHALAGLRHNAEAFGSGPKWTFAVDAIDAGVPYVAHVDTDLANPNVPRGDANISYSSHPDHRGRGYVSRAVRLVARFLALHTGVRTAHICVDERNEASLRVARAVRATPVGSYVDTEGHTMVRHLVPVGLKRR